ncbi:MAG: chemotaxis protein CheB [Thermomicrobiales bacterium]
MGRDIVVAGASAGGVEALGELVSGLPGDLPASVFVVLHTPPTATSQLPAILARSGPLPVVHATDGMAIEHGRIYVAPPDYHLVLQTGSVRVVYGPKENRCRPAVDVLFRGAAVAYGPRVVGVLLSGLLSDGTAGMRAIKQRGGLALVQHPREALFGAMPANAIAGDDIDAILPLADLSARLVELAHAPTPERETPVAGTMRQEAELVKTFGSRELMTEQHPGTPSGIGCPECGGVLWELPEKEDLRFRCRIGHAYSPESLMLAQGESLEDALWVALRTLQEQVDISTRLAARAAEWQQDAARQQYAERAAAAAKRAQTLQRLLEDGPLPPPPTGT